MVGHDALAARDLLDLSRVRFRGEVYRPDTVGLLWARYGYSSVRGMDVVEELALRVPGMRALGVTCHYGGDIRWILDPLLLAAMGFRLAGGGRLGQDQRLHFQKPDL